MKTHTTYLKKLNACPEAVGWADQFPTLQDAWDNCDRGEWMLWLLGKQVGEPGTKSRKKLVLTACKCARLSLKYIPEDEKRPIKAIQTAEKYARGVKGITLQDVRSAAAAVYDYAADADDAAADAADAAAYADAADAAAYAAHAAAYAYAAAAAAARKNALKECANIVRKDYPKIRIKSI